MSACQEAIGFWLFAIAFSSCNKYTFGLVGMAKHLTVDEQALVDRIIKKQRLPPLDALASVQAQRESQGDIGPSRSAIYRYLNGGTHPRGPAGH